MPDTSTDVKQTWVLEMQAPAELQPKWSDRDDLTIRQVLPVCPEFNWFLHEAVGAEFRWGGRETWREAEWTEYASRPQLQTWVGYVAGTPAGYFEIEKQDDNSVRIHCFGLLSRFFGAGIGGHLLTRDALYFHYPNYAWHRSNRLGGAIREGSLKLVENFDDGSHELYDLSNDLSEKHNLAGERPDDAARLRKRLAQWRDETSAAMPLPVPQSDQ